MKAFDNIKRNFIIIVIILIWIIGSSLSWWNSYILPSPWDVVSSMILLLKSGELLMHIGISTLRVVEGFSITICLAVPMGILFGINNKLYKYFEGPLEFLRHTPPLALIPLLILWFGIGEKPKIIVIVLASFFPVLLNTIGGVKSCDRKLLEVGRTFDLDRYDIFKKIIIPWTLPDILVGMRLGAGYSWRAIIGAEMIAASSGLGYLILDGQQLSRSSVIIVGILCIGIMGYITDKMFDFVTRKFDYMQREAKDNGRL